MGEDKYIANKIRELRKAAGLDVETVGKGVGRSGKTVSAWETGRNMPSPEMLISICRFFGVSISCFYPPDVTEEDWHSELPENIKELVRVCENLSDSQIELLTMNARQFAIANKKNREGIAEDALLAERAVR